MIYKNDFINIKNEGGKQIEIDSNINNSLNISISKELNKTLNLTLNKTSNKSLNKTLTQISELDLENYKDNILEKENEIKIRIFGKSFVNNNKNICHLIIDGKKYGLKEFYVLNKDFTKEKIKIKLIKEKPLKDMSYMFEDCTNLLSFCEYSDYWENPETISIKYMFSNCTSLINLPNMNCWDTSNINDMQYLFNNCSSLKYLPDISNWNLSKVESISNMFKDCKSLISLPDISKWETPNLIETDQLFFNCHSLKNIPDISNWDLKM